MNEIFGTGSNEAASSLKIIAAQRLHEAPLLMLTRQTLGKSLRWHCLPLLLLLTAIAELSAPLCSGQMLGSRIQLEGFYPDLDSPVYTTPIKTITASDIEFPNLAQYVFNAVNVDIDFTDSSITITFTGNMGHFSRFLSATFNGYVFTDIDDTIPDFMGFSIDTSVTTLGIQPSAVTFNKNQLFINVSGLSFNDATVAKFNVSFAKLHNISTRAFIQTGDKIAIGGLIVTGTEPKSVLFRALGPALGSFNVPNVLVDPILELHDASGAVIATNDNWQQAANANSIPSNLRPPNSLESAILTSLTPGSYTAVVRGVNNGSGNALFEAYDVGSTSVSKLQNISTRANVQTGDGVMIAGVIVQGAGSENVVVRALGPTLGQPPYNIVGALADPTLTLYDSNGNVIAFNDNWADSQQAQIQATGLAPPNSVESAIAAVFVSGNYTAIVRGKNNTTGVALVEVYEVP